MRVRLCPFGQADRGEVCSGKDEQNTGEPRRSCKYQRLQGAQNSSMQPYDDWQASHKRARVRKGKVKPGPKQHSSANNDVYR